MNRYRYLKYFIDRIISFSVIIIGLPLIVAVAIFIKIYSPKGTVFYGHKRIGRDGKYFTCWKFRTMVPNADEILSVYLNDHEELRKEYEEFYKLKKDPRIIPVVGKFLRKTSLDEFPQFFNVLMGDMSVIGPRPIVDDEKERYGKYFEKLVSIKPGISGLWQIAGRSDISYQDRVMLDMKYIDTISLKQDIIIVLKTVKVILDRKGY